MPDVFDFSSEESADETGSLSDPKLPAARPKRTKKRGLTNIPRMDSETCTGM